MWVWGLRSGEDGFDENGEEGEKESFLPTAFGRKIKEGAERRREQIQIGEESAARREGVLRVILYDSGNVRGFEKYPPRELE